jgi:hypothetical protein
LFEAIAIEWHNDDGLDGEYSRVGASLLAERIVAIVTMPVARASLWPVLPVLTRIGERTSAQVAPHAMDGVRRKLGWLKSRLALAPRIRKLKSRLALAPRTGVVKKPSAVSAKRTASYMDYMEDQHQAGVLSNTNIEHALAGGPTSSSVCDVETFDMEAGEGKAAPPATGQQAGPASAEEADSTPMLNGPLSDQCSAVAISGATMATSAIHERRASGPSVDDLVLMLDEDEDGSTKGNVATGETPAADLLSDGRRASGPSLDDLVLMLDEDEDGSTTGETPVAVRRITEL